MEPETKKKIAEQLEWTDVCIIGVDNYMVIGVPPECSMEEEFDINNELWGCVEKFDLSLIKYKGRWFIADSEKSLRNLVKFTDDYIGYKTPKAAVIAALNEIFKDEECI